MLLMGDEVSRSQGGNNNTWCQDGPLGSMIWESSYCDLAQKEFVKKLLIIRKQLPELFSPTITPTDVPLISEKEQNALWVQWHGIHTEKPDWSNWSHTISFSINEGSLGSVMWMGLNAYSKAMNFELPEPKSNWELMLNTSIPSPNDLPIRSKPPSQKAFEIESRSMVVMLASEYASRIHI